MYLLDNLASKGCFFFPLEWLSISQLQSKIGCVYFCLLFSFPPKFVQVIVWYISISIYLIAANYIFRSAMYALLWIATQDVLRELGRFVVFFLFCLGDKSFWVVLIRRLTLRITRWLGVIRWSENGQVTWLFTIIWHWLETIESILRWK